MHILTVNRITYINSTLLSMSHFTFVIRDSTNLDFRLHMEQPFIIVETSAILKKIVTLRLFFRNFQMVLNSHAVFISDVSIKIAPYEHLST